MGWMTCVDRRGRGWAVDPDGCAHIFRACHYNRLLVQRSRIIRTSEGWFGPTITQVETDFTGIRDATTRAASANIQTILRDIDNDPARFYEYLVDVYVDAKRAGAYQQNMRLQASQETARAINSNVEMWENAVAAAKFVRDVSAGMLMVGATILSGGAALAVGAAGTGLTFAGNTQDNLASGQTLQRALGNATISTTISVVTNILIPKGLGAVGRAMQTSQMTFGQRFAGNVALGLIGVQANIGGDMVKTALTADQVFDARARQMAERQMRAQLGARASTEMVTMLFSAWLQSRGVPVNATISQLEQLERSAQIRDSVVGGTFSAINDRIVEAMSRQDRSAASSRLGRDLDIVFTQLYNVFEAEQYVREVAMRPL